MEAVQLPQSFSSKEIDWILNVTKLVSKQPERDLCILGFFFGSPLTTLEINLLKVKDVIDKHGVLNKRFKARGIEFKGRDVYLTNEKLRNLLEDYISYRVDKKIGVSGDQRIYFGLKPENALFYSSQHSGFSIASRITVAGSLSYSCEALNRHIKQLMRKSGIQNPSTLSGRKTFAENLFRKGVDLNYIHQMLGNKSLETTKSLVANSSVNFADIMAEAF